MGHGRGMARVGAGQGRVTYPYLYGQGIGGATYPYLYGQGIGGVIPVFVASTRQGKMKMIHLTKSAYGESRSGCRTHPYQGTSYIHIFKIRAQIPSISRYLIHTYSQNQGADPIHTCTLHGLHCMLGV